MGRTEYWYDENAPKPNTLIPACNMLAARETDGAILLQRRRDTGQYALPGGAMDIGESPSQCAVRECKEETGVDVVPIGLLGVYSRPEHVVAYTDGEIRQAYEVTVIGRPVGGVPTVNDEADDVRWVLPVDLESYDIHPSMRRQIADYLDGSFPHVD
ncbi:NUDIX hydrolase [Streptomyces canus]|uniref:NUDIX hydrolase n=1 Tax=Streptomyces canus TaxID=58343 RepID=UPI0036E5A40C